MTGFFEDNLLRFEGLTDQDIADLNKILPDLQHLGTILNSEWPRINRVAPVLIRAVLKILAKQKELSQ